MENIPDLTQFFLAAIGILLAITTFNTRDILLLLRREQENKLAITVNNTTGYKKGDIIKIGGEVVKITSIQDRSFTVERGKK